MAAENRVVDLLVVGGGTAGIIGAQTAAGFGADTVLVEQARTGGDCLWTGCLPSKTLLRAAEHALTARALTGHPPTFDSVRDRIFASITTIEPVDSPEALENAGVEVLKGTLVFRAPGMAVVNGETIRFRQALIATGAAPTGTVVPGLDPGVTVTSETIRDLETLPKRLAIIGGRPLGCELGQGFARLGSEVTLIIRSRILPKEDPEAAAIIRDSLKTDGVRILENTTVQNAYTAEGRTRIRLGDGTTIETDTVLLATGRTPRTADLGLARVGVDLDADGQVITDARMMTSNPVIWAAGDVTAHPRFTHLAGVHASIAATNAVLGLKRGISPTMPRVTFTSPEVGAVGLTTANTGSGHRTRVVRHTHLDRAVTHGATNGFTKLITDRRGKILGGTIVSPRAGESLAELTLAIQNNMTTSDITATTHPYPTYSDGLWNAAITDVQARLRSPASARALKGLTWLRRRWLERPGSRYNSG
ncbi:dihydrolipoyl dehydrogenase family protein [Arthrobacter sp. SO3]|uniref:dihydrolipoyl dehydrogenase family protein n=1 Tax=Arthrobacter sp. SO3 TaxID=1897057 RepID=UPI001CFF98FD|nr:NAD(P)/FAD-dependent oxidoreductase [Arthrobacter sp. SO3]MCB5292147.1 Mercuric reductase [Arthrobacter sp. SO3]